ncbi:HNH endonuclease [Pedomonas sp. V897]|uniref:HNH endonuclease n=1 Tax=Pedomonas sp. V897 TaxID=3446482 RepID=UPI003EE30F2C
MERCALCGRPLGARVEWHHVVPKSRGGRDVVPVHPICHRTIHATLSEVELERLYPGMDAVRQHPAIARFLAWVADKPPDFHKRTEPKGGRRRR